MPKLPPSGYVPAAQHSVGFAKRMRMYRAQVEAEKQQKEQNAIEVREKVKTLKVKP